MPLNSNLVGLLASPTEDGFEKGTAYPIRDGVVITAAHVIPNIQDYNDSDNKSSYIKWPDGSRPIVQRVIFCCEEVDVAVLNCDTPDQLDKVLFSKLLIPGSSESWDSEGFARSAETVDTHELESATGKFLKKVDKQPYQQLETRSYMSDESFWQGMSGAPIFKSETDYLVGIFIESSVFYTDTDGSEVPIFNGRLKAASIAFLLENQEFEKAVYGEKKGPDYQQLHAEKLQGLWGKTPILKEHFPSCEALIERFKSSQSTCVQELSKQLPESCVDAEEETFSRLLALLLSQIEIPNCDKQENHTYDLEVGTPLLSEVAVAKLYNAEPRFKPSEKGVSGVEGIGVIPASVTEKGFDTAAQGEEAARAISHAVYKQAHGKELKDIHSKKAITRYHGLNSHLKNMREQAEAIIYRYELDKEDAEHDKHPLMNKETQKALQELLPEMLIAFFGEDYAFDDEPALETQVGVYMGKLKQ